MPVTVSLQGNSNAEGNPYINEVGQASSDAVKIYSGGVGDNRRVVYQIMRKDGAAFDGINGHTVLNIPWNFGTSELIKSISINLLTIVLPLRTEYRVRVSTDNGHKFGDGRGNESYTNGRWVDFKTRDKSYALPDTNTELRVNQEDSLSGATVIVSNHGKATVYPTSRGARVENRDKMSNEVSSIQDTTRGATITTRQVEYISDNGVIIRF